MIQHFLQWLWTTLTANTFADWANVLSFVSAIIGFSVLRELKRIKREVRQRRSVEALSTQLNAHVETYQEYLRDMGAYRNEIPEEFARVETSFAMLIQVVHKSQRQRVQDALREVKQFQSQAVTEEQLRRMHRDMIYFERLVEQIKEEIQWRI